MADKEWYYSDGEDQHGPVSNADLKRLAAKGELKPDYLVWCDGMDDWQPASEMKGLISSTKSKPKPARKAPRPARRPAKNDSQKSDSEQAASTQERSPDKDDKKAKTKVAPPDEPDSVDVSEPDEIEEVEEVVDEEPVDLPDDDEEEEDSDEESLDESLGLDDPSLDAGVSHAAGLSTVVNVTQPTRGMAHSLVLLIVWAVCGVFVAVGGATFVMKWRSLEESAAVTAEAGAFVVQFVGAYVFARATERVLQLLADMSRR